MRICRNIWKPNTTCATPSCEIEFAFDGDLDGDALEATKILHAVHRKCPAHAMLTDEEVWEAVRVENPQWMFAQIAIAEALPELFWTPQAAADHNRAALVAQVTTPKDIQAISALPDETVSLELSKRLTVPVSAVTPRAGVIVTCTYEGTGKDRMLVIDAPSLTAEERVAVKDAAVAVIGEDRVQVKKAI